MSYDRSLTHDSAIFITLFTSLWWLLFHILVFKTAAGILFREIIYSDNLMMQLRHCPHTQPTVFISTQKLVLKVFHFDTWHFPCWQLGNITGQAHGTMSSQPDVEFTKKRKGKFFFFSFTIVEEPALCLLLLSLMCRNILNVRPSSVRCRDWPNWFSAVNYDTWSLPLCCRSTWTSSYKQTALCKKKKRNIRYSFIA